MWFAVLYEVKVTWVASVSMWIRQESWEESKNEEWHVPCVPREIFYEQLDALKNKQAKKESQITLFIEDSFFDKAKGYLKYLEDWIVPDKSILCNVFIRFQLRWNHIMLQIELDNKQQLQYHKVTLL